MKLIPLTRGKFAKVDDEDFDWLNQWKWNCQKTKTPGRFYAYRGGLNEETGKKRSISMHRQIMGVKDRTMDVDHEDLDGLNNQRSNLSVCGRSFNNVNSLPPKNNTSGFKGVGFDEKRNLWLASVGGKYAGRFEMKEDAARAYNKLAFDTYGKYARLNDVYPIFPTSEKPKVGRSNTSGYLGVSKCGRKWLAEISPNRKKFRLGIFESIEDAARAYDAAAKIHYGSKAKLNFPDE